jgi:putative copper resistance protein D
MSELLIPLLEMATKLLIYLGGAAVIGGLFIAVLAKGQLSLMMSVRRFVLLGSVIGLLAVGINFIAQVGSFAESGWAGMIDATYVTMLWNSSIGQSAGLRACVFGLSLTLIVFVGFRPVDEHFPGSLTITLFSVAALLLAASFNLIGHSSALPVLARLLLSLHVLIALLWMGSLFPLWQACRTMDVSSLQRLMHRFGVVASGLVSVLIICGGVVAYQLLGDVMELVTTPYGLMLLAKVAFVALILGFAAWHKFRLVPGLATENSSTRLQRSIQWEGLTGLIILVVTLLLTTVAGPESLND